MPLGASLAGQARSVTPMPHRESKSDVVRHWLLRQISSGAFGRNQRLPSESDLMGQFGVSRVTVRRALDRLRQSGLVEGQQGRGYFVRRVRAIQNLGRLEGFGEMMAALGVEVRSSVLEIGEVEAADEVAAGLQLRRGEPVTRIARLRIAGGVTLSYDVSYFPLAIGRRLAELDLPRNDIFKLLETELGIELGVADLRMEVARHADAEVARNLGIEPGEPVLRIERTTFDTAGRPIDFEYLYGVADAFQFRVRVPRW
jgi:GntR family transcriptional regulator